MLPPLAPPTLRPSRRPRRFPRGATILTVLALLLATVATRLWAAVPAYHRQGEPLRGELHIAGSRDAAAPVARWAAILRREHPGVHVSTMLWGTGTGAGAIADGEADLVPLDRVLRPHERALIAATGQLPRSVAVGRWTAGTRPFVLYFRRGAGQAADAIAAEFARIALSAEGRAALDRGR